MMNIILKEALVLFEKQNVKNNISILDFIDRFIYKKSNILFEEVNNGSKEEFEKSNLKNPFVI